mgnify:CR=1 FL=1
MTSKKSKRIIIDTVSLDRETAYCSSSNAIGFNLLGRKFFVKYKFFFGDKDQKIVYLTRNFCEMKKDWDSLQNEIYDYV